MAVEIPFVRELAFEYGRVDQISPMIRRVVARNPGPFTLYGTGTYIIGKGKVAVIDPGPYDAEHIACVAAAVEGEQITHQIITHTHNDHSPGSRLLREYTDAKTYAYGPHGAGKREQGVQVEEGGDMEFTPDVEVRHGDVVRGEGWSLEAVYTPGHTSNHVCFALREEKVLFSGDHVMGWSTSIISPPDGDMNAYMASLRLLLDRDDVAYWPTHGPRIDDPKAHVRAFIAHRQERERQILECLGAGVHRIADMVPKMYIGLDPKLIPAAGRSVYAAMMFMVDNGQVVTDGVSRIDGEFRLP
ncbi:MAG: glyoxylase-like metal-dependent hydrolase (beta-lactamase superfamily II) [Gammaproteobacteria bacterium]|jgi:glyoxylase-like metal-dependent hydrolase (beta-lactamase superfamily II)